MEGTASLWALLALLVLSCGSSLFAATFGLGGGMLLLAAMPGLVPPAVLIPLHGVAQLASNASRAALGWRDVARQPLAAYTLGAVIGAALGAPVLQVLPASRIPLVLGGFILLVTWLPVGRWLMHLPGGYAAVAAVQTAVSLFVGAAGPLSAPLMNRPEWERDRIVVTHAATMTVMHALKLMAFLAVGFALGDYLLEAAVLIAGTSLGSYVGMYLRRPIPHQAFRHLFRVILTLLALRMIVGWAV